jgi:predicted GNAT family N-acyltransferase
MQERCKDFRQSPLKVNPSGTAFANNTLNKNTKHLETITHAPQVMINIFPITYEEKNIAELIHEIRRKVFVVEGKVDPLYEFDTYETESSHYLAYCKNKAVGTARWRMTGNGIKLERFSVLKEYRNNGIGMALIKRVLADVLPSGENIYLHAQTTTVKFFEKAGFAKTGEVFIEAGIAHYRMELINPMP